MSAYPPPPPPPNAPAYDRENWKAQRRVWEAQRKAYVAQAKAQARLQRAHLRAQARAARRGSLVGPLLLVGLGLVFLLTQVGTLSWGHAAEWYSRWWPAVLICAGLLLMAEWTFARQRQATGYTTPVPILGGGLVVLLIVLACVGWSLRYVNSDHEWNQWFGSDFTTLLGEVHEADDAATNPISAGQALIIRCPHGDITVTGAASDGEVHVSAHKQVHAWSDSQAEQRLASISPHFSSSDGQLVLTVFGQEGGQSDLTVEVPHDTPVTIEAGRGDITINELHAPVTLTDNHGSVEMSGIDGIAQVHMDYDSGSVTGHSMTGPVTVEGRSGDIDFTDISGPVTLQGDFFGSTHLERVNGVVRFQTSRTQFEAQRLDGEFEVDTGADLQADQLVGPLNLNTRNRNIELDRVAGHIEITNRNGSVAVTNAPPFAGIQITNTRGSVDVGVPSGASFVLNAQTRHGDVENDFGIPREGSDDAPVLKGEVGSNGPLVSIITTDGDVTVRKSSVAPLPPAPPAPPKVVNAPEAPPAPAKPQAKPPKPPTRPKKPSAPEHPPAPGQ